MSNYPPGTSAGDPNAPWNQPEVPECRCCENRIRDPDDHDDDCHQASLEPNEIYQQREEDAKAARAEAQLEQQRLEEREPDR